MRMLAASLIGLLLVVAPATAQTPEQPRGEHEVRAGDTLWALAARYLGDPFRWREIADANAHVIADPHRIEPGQVLVIPGAAARAALAEPIGDPLTPDAAEPAGEGVFTPVAARDEPARTVFYDEPPVREATGPTVLIDAVRVRLPVQPGEFLAAPFLADPAALTPVGQVLRPVRQRQEVAGLTRSAHPSDDLYVSYDPASRPAVGEELVVVAAGRRAPELGREVRSMEPRAVLRVESVSAEVLTARVEQQFGRVSAADLVLRPEPLPEFAAAAPSPVDGAFDLEGRLLLFAEEQTLYGRLARGFIDLGRAHGVRPGDIFEVFLPERRLRSRGDDFRRTEELAPAETIAVVRVIRVGETTSTVLVDEVMSHSLTDGVGVRRIRKMP